MKISKFEPHVLAPLASINDASDFMSDLDEQTQSGQITVIADFIKRKKRRRKLSKRAVAISAYERQKKSRKD